MDTAIYPTNPAVLILSSRSKVRVKQLTIREDMLCLIHSGTKHLMENELTRTSFKENSLLIFHKGSVIDIINEPALHSAYKATVISLAPAYIEGFNIRQQTYLTSLVLKACKPNTVDGVSLVSTDTLLKETFARTASSIQAINDDKSNLDVTIYKHRLDELLLTLASRGHQFNTNQSTKLSDKIAKLISHQLGKAWTKAVVANRLNISESTLDRGLKKESLSFSQLLRNMRLEQAMSLLLQGNHAVGEVALACGYQSPSAFSQAFYKHFDASPSSIY